MKIILNIAWRNIWRNKLRSLVVIVSIALGIWSGIFVSAFSFGLNDQRKEALLRNQFSHLQFHKASWKEEPKVSYTLPEPSTILGSLQNDPRVSAAAPRLIVNGMAATAHYSGGVQIYGVEASAENDLTDLASKLDTGTFFNDEGRNPLLIGAALAEKLEVRLDSKVILSFSNSEQEIVSASFKVRGVYREVSSTVEKMKLYVRAKDLQQLLDFGPNDYHEIAVFLRDESQSDSLKAHYQTLFPKAYVESWKDLAPELAYSDSLMEQMLYIIIGIIMLALSFGIINTMLMAVLERRKEIGVLMSVGMAKSRIFGMIMIETFYLALLGGPIGVILGYLSVQQGAKEGLSLEVFSEGLSTYGIGTTIYPVLPSSFYWGTAAIVFVMTLLAALYPARHALKLNPIEAIRTI